MQAFYLSVAILQITLILKPSSVSCSLYSNAIDNELYDNINPNGRRNYGRISRKTVPTSAIQNGEVYKIENERNSLYLTARNGEKTPGLSILKKWANYPNQLWEASKIDKGFILKPLLNEFNSITSQIDHHAHAYNTYNFQNIGNGNWLIKNVVSSQCISSGGNQKLIKIVKCSKMDKGQKWKFYPVQKKK